MQFHDEGGGQQHQGYDTSDEDSDDDDEPGSKRARKSEGPSDRKEKHKVVEQKRREKTKELLAELQDLLPSSEEMGASNFTMNTVLQHAIDFLTARAGRSDEQSLTQQAQTAGGVDVDLTYRAGFMTSSTGIAYAGVDGTILEVNPSFATLLGYPTDQRQKLIGRTIFSLTAPQDMQNMLKAVSRLLSGELNQASWAERFVRADGGHSLFSVQMNCLWKTNKASCIVCFIVPTDEAAAPPPRVVRR
eukprot:CAMPEP_0113692462 /NCGR_PEP_ID=MMETSP0038_2-20120614/19094_1 /TAXON_ID=2898 /ORGANISM="Cryptomonas paramecium" /LENGTH=245 /DNA_ID=CAMNT_0000614369 /DNA_START=210 /DNA_END=943 /DNA_ORIENTATION=+ /assembly_acc=CAM_ASM_000170